MKGQARPSRGRTERQNPTTRELAERIERLEQRIDDSVLGDDGVAAVDDGIDREPSGDALQRAVRRSNLKRGSRKA